MSDDPASNIWIRDIIWRTLRDAADEDYVVARWAAKMDLHHQFSWSGQQAIEKYCKCVLAMNGVPIPEYAHELSSLFSETKLVARELLPDLWCNPRYVRKGVGARRFELYDDIIGRFDKQGDTEQRYRTYGGHIFREDLHKLDELVFRLRRLTIPLEKFNEDFRKSYREHLQNEPNFELHRLESSRIFSQAKSGKERLLIFRWANFSFFEDRAISDGEWTNGILATSSPISMSARREDEESAKAINWAIKNLRLRKRDKNELLEYMRRK